MSGGRATVKAKKGISLHAQTGDITAIHPMGHFFTKLFMIECKHYRDIQWVPCLYERSSSAVRVFWLQLLKDSNSFCKAPMMIVRQNNYPNIVILDSTGEEICINNRFQPLLIIPKLQMKVYLLKDLLLLPFDEIRTRNAGKRIRQRLRTNNSRPTSN